jgi:phage shock protein A
MVAQVDLILVQRDNYDEIVAELERVLVKVGEKQTELRARIDSTKATLSTLGAKKTIAKIDKLTGEADELLREVSELLGDNAAAVEELDSPVRTVEQLTGSLPAAKPSGSATRERALSFLEGGA